MRELALRQTERSLDVLRQVLGLLDSSDDGGVNGLLVCCLRLRELSLLRLALREELLLCRARTLLGRLGEVSVVDLLVDLAKNQNRYLCNGTRKGSP